MTASKSRRWPTAKPCQADRGGRPKSPQSLGCEVVEGQFVWGVTRCMKVATDTVLDSYGDPHWICAEHKDAS